MIDVHTHILPGIDDGAQDVEEAAGLISLLKTQGVSLAVLTPHYYPYRESLSSFLERRDFSYRRIIDCDFKMILGSETYLCESLLSYRTIDELTIKNTRYLLLELPFIDKWGPSVFRQINRVITKYNVKPIIAHAERYAQIRDNNALQELVDLGCLIQANIDSVVNRKTRAASLKLFEEGWIDVVGSDCHSLTERPPQFDAFNKVMRKKFKADFHESLYL